MRAHAAFGLLNSTPHSAFLPEDGMRGVLHDMAARALALEARSMSTTRWFSEWSDADRAAYATRFTRLAAAGHDIDGEARFVDALADRRSRILDAGCGTGRVAAALAARGHDARGVDADASLIEAGREQHPGVPLEHRDLLDLVPEDGPFDVVVGAGNVLVYVEPGTEAAMSWRPWPRCSRPAGRRCSASPPTGTTPSTTSTTTRWTSAGCSSTGSPPGSSAPGTTTPTGRSASSADLSQTDSARLVECPMRFRLGRPALATYADRFDVPAAEPGGLSVTFLGVSTLLSPTAPPR